MADIQIQQKSGRRKLATPKIDLTPMVDLGFILITFFIYTTTIMQPKLMDLKVPDKSNKAVTAYIDTSTITVVPIGNHKIAYYSGALNKNVVFQYMSFNDIGNYIRKKQSNLKQLSENFSKEAHDLHLIIKPNDDCTYDDFVRIIDEVQINDIKYYAIDDITPIEKELLTKRLQTKM
ncbi:MAG: biopolymer transporter ExbD [Bacteroidetes bacterium]|nr:biopolymer transporter ExbD [Bacteroidota bacterium]